MKEVAVALLALADPLYSQRAVDAHIADWIERLHDKDPLERDIAVHRLVALGEPAARALVRQLDKGDGLEVPVLQTLGKMGPDALVSVELLVDRYGEQQELEVERALQLALLGIAPFSDTRELLHERFVEVLPGRRLPSDRRARTRRLGGSVDVDLATVLESSIRVLNTMSRREPGEVDLVEWLDQLRSAGPWKAVGVAVLVGRSESKDPSICAALRTFLLIEQFGSFDPDVLLPFAEAILRLDASSDDAIDAHAYLIQHGDTYQQRNAFIALREFGARSARVADTVCTALQDDSLDPRLLGELIVTAGIIDAFADRDAKQAIETELTRLTTHGDAQIAARAKSALRQVHR